MSEYPRGYKPGKIYGDPSAFSPYERLYKSGQVYGDPSAFNKQPVAEFTPTALQSEKPKTGFETMYQSGKTYGDPVTTTANMINPRTGKLYKDSPGKASSEKNALIYNPKTREYEQQKRTTEESNPISRDLERDGAKGTQTSLAPVKPETFDAIAARYQALNPSIRYNQDFNFYNENSGSSSNSLPTTPGNVPDPRRAVQIKTGMNAGQTLYLNDPNYQEKLDGEMGIGTREFLIDGNYEREIAQGAQRGSSGAFDIGEQGTQVSSGLKQARNGVTAYDPSKYKGDVNSSAVAQQLMLAKGRDRRGEAFLDGSANSFEALRGAELAQGYITAGGEKYGRGKDGELQKLSSNAVAALKADPNAVASQDFLAQYMKMPATPADQQSSDSAMPVAPSTVTPEQLRDRMSLGSPFFETDATKIDGIQGWTELPGDNREYLTRTLPARADVSEPSHSWLPTEYEMEQSLYETREPYMRYSSN